jgi:hypothetical protein
MPFFDPSRRNDLPAPPAPVMQQEAAESGGVPEGALKQVIVLYYGVSKRSEAGLIEITGLESDGELVLSVRDNGPGDVASEGQTCEDSRCPAAGA